MNYARHLDPLQAVVRLRAFGWAAVCALLYVTSNLPVRAENVPAKGLVDGRVRSATYNAEQVYRLHGYVGYEIDLQFEPGEAFVGLGAGDVDGVSFVAQDNHLFIKPRAGNVATNMTVLTSRRAYQIEYSASVRRPDWDDDVIYALRFSYPQRAEAADVAALDRVLAHPGVTRPVNRDYWYCGSPALNPLAASDDGVHTRLRFGARAEQPAIFVENDDGTESLLNFSMDEGDVIIHRVARRFIVRRGRLSGRIMNQNFDGGGERLKSGTVSPEVERSVEGAHP